VLSDSAHSLKVNLAFLATRRDVVEDNLVDLILIETLREILCGCNIDVVLKTYGLRYASVDDIEASDQAFSEH
jgi:hypothetical protein